MEIRHLKYFKTLAEELHFGRASERLFIAQPPLSRQIMQLEESLGVKLFHRNKRNVQLTEPGKYLLKEVDHLLNRLQHIREGIKLVDRGVAGQISIGYVGATMHSILPDVLLKMKNVYAQVNTVLLELSNEDQITGVRSGRIDVGFVRTPMQAKGVVIKEILREKFCLVLPKNFKLKTSGESVLGALANESFIAFARDCGPGLVDSPIKICNQAGFSPKVVHETTQINSILRLVEIGLGYAIVPSSVKRGYELKLQFIELEQFEETATLSLVYHKDNQKPAVLNFISLIENRFKE